ncbi:MAG TPA: SAM-dependent methyltransferase [Methylibium sp.]|uniref:class I SAM-dependent methyltransferase n=1 Tax=Methylibium sp. TaxID=2067992 RepID=UPI002DBAE66C|nr:SAM-dependent methyltransferase [Methylibium sp.]HEU4460889.1 SAM-dependent methyltransferase [Methylibium sp.]
MTAHSALHRRIADEIAAAGGWLGFERYMELALYAPGLGYYARGDRVFGDSPASGSDFVTAPELSPLFGRALARQLRQALDATGTREVWEFGAGSGALAAQLTEALGDAIERYTIVELSAALRERQRATLAARQPDRLARVAWAEALPARLDAVLVGNEVLDAMPVALLHFDGAGWFERGVALDAGRVVFADRPTALRPPLAETAVPGTTTELGRHAEAFVRTLAATLGRGAAFFIDYGFPEAEFHHPQRRGGTLMCHRGHRADGDPLVDIGLKDITAHVDFTAIALAGQDAGFEVLGYTSQAHFLVNCGLLDDLHGADVATVSRAQKLLTEHEMGELFKVIGFAKPSFDAIGFRRGDRSHTL